MICRLIREMESLGICRGGQPDSGKDRHGGGSCGGTSLEKTKHEHPRSILLDAAVIQGQARLSSPIIQQEEG